MWKEVIVVHPVSQIRATILLILCVAALFLAAEVFYVRTPSTCYLPASPPSVSQSTADRGTLPLADAGTE